MAATVTSVNERQHNASADDQKESVRFVREFIVELSEADSSGVDIAMNAANVPVRGDAWPNILAGRVNPRCTGKRCRPLSEEKKTFFIVECEYSNAADQLGGSGIGTVNTIPPWEEKPSYNYDFVAYPKALEVDMDGRTVRNSAGDRFDPMPEVLIHNRKVSIRRNTLLFGPNDAGEIQDTVNENQITVNGEVIGERRAHLLRWSADSALWVHPTTGIIVTYYQELIEIEICRKPEDTSGDNPKQLGETNPYPTGFLLNVVDAGYHYIESSTKKRFRDDQENDLQTVGFLNGSGDKLANPQTDKPYVWQFRQYQNANWSALTRDPL